jgi:hypothetical protein
VRGLLRTSVDVRGFWSLYSSHGSKMPKLVLPLTDAKIKNAKPREKAYKLSDVGGLYLEVSPGRLRTMAAGLYTRQRQEEPPDPRRLPCRDFGGCAREAPESEAADRRRHRSGASAKGRQTTTDHQRREYFRGHRPRMARQQGGQLERKHTGRPDPDFPLPAARPPMLGSTQSSPLRLGS